MKFFAYRVDQAAGLAIETGGEQKGLDESDPHYPGALDQLLSRGALALSQAADTIAAHGTPVDLTHVTILPPVMPSKIICVGLNYRDHAEETGLELPDSPTVFSRWASSIVGADQPLVRPAVSGRLDFEGELAVIIGTRGRHIPRERALDHVGGYSCFNDGSVRDYQLRTPQWTLGKNFDQSGSLGPALVTPDALPPGAAGLAIRTLLNGEVMQASTTDQLLFDVGTLIALISEVLTLEPGDVIATGTPSGVGFTRQPPVWMKAGDQCEVEIEGIGCLRNPVRDEILRSA